MNSDSGERPLAADIQQRAIRDFGEVDGKRVYQRLLDEIPRESQGGGFERLLRCILHSANGDESLVESGMRLLELDYRDLIMGAEYEGEVRKFDFSQPFPVG